MKAGRAGKRRGRRLLLFLVVLLVVVAIGGTALFLLPGNASVTALGQEQVRLSQQGADDEAAGGAGAGEVGVGGAQDGAMDGPAGAEARDADDEAAGGAGEAGMGGSHDGTMEGSVGTEARDADVDAAGGIGAGDADAGSADDGATDAGEGADSDAEAAAATLLGSTVTASGRYRVETAAEGELTIGFTGDILLDPGYAIYARYRQRSYALESCISADLLDALRGVDVLMVNNEFPYSDRGSALPDKTFTFRAPTSAVSALQEMGVDIAGVANNHAFDYGETAFLDTLDTLTAAGIPAAGAGHDLAEASRPIILYAAGMRVGIVAASQIERYSDPSSRGATTSQPGMLRSWPDITPVLDAIRAAKEECDVVILFIHWGTENMVEPDWCQNEQLPRFLEAGVDVVIGAHPHILQPIAWVGGVPVVYSMGNFWFNSKTLDSCMIELTLADGGVRELRFLPCLQSDCGVSLLHGEDAARLLDYMRSISPTVEIDAEGVVRPR